MGSFGNTPAVIYCRVSSEKQVRNGDGLNGQEKRCRDYADIHRHKIIDVFKDAAKSGGSVDRPAFFEMLERIKSSKECVTVIIDDLSRLARDVSIHRSFKSLIIKNGGRLQCVNMDLNDSPEGQFIETIIAATGELEKEQNKLRVKGRQKSRLEAGYWVFNNPVGYKFTFDSVHGKILMPDEPSASIIRQAFEKYASDVLITQKDVVYFLRDKVLVNSKGNVQKVSFEDVKRIFKRPIYAGMIEYEAWDISRREGRHEGLVSIKVFNEVQKKLNSKKTVYKCSREEDFPLRNYIICSECGRNLTGAWTTGRNNKYSYYRCLNTKTCSIKSKSVATGHVEGEFIKLLDSVQLKPQVISLAKRITEEVYNIKMVGFRERHNEQRNAVRNVEVEISSVLDKLMACSSKAVITRLEQEIDKLSLQKVCLEQELLDVKSEPVSLDVSIGRVMDFIGSPREYWESGDLSQKRLVQTLMFTRPIEYSKDNGFGTANFSLPFSLLQETSGSNSKLVETAGIEPASASTLPSALHA